MNPLILLTVVATVISSTPVTRDKRSVMALAGAGFPFGGGAYAGGGFGFPFFPSPFDYSRAFMPMPWPIIPFSSRSWYEGENVCTTTKEIHDPKELQEWLSEASASNIDYNHESEQCQGTSTKYVCFKRYVNNGESKMKLTKYECCHGFVRNPSGSGCVETGASSQGQRGRPEDVYYFPQQQSSSSSTSSRSVVGGVPIQ